MSYIVLARKYRPMTFSEMVNQEAVVQTLQNALKNDRVAQAYIFSGPRGVGKTTAARILAKALNCQKGPTPTPCNACEHCLEITDDKSVDVIEIDAATYTGVDNIRDLQDALKYKPIKSRNKVVIIDEVHMLSKSSFNALLKTLEEPPSNTFFIFATTEFNKVPATIISRCQHFEFKRISQKEIINHLLDITKKEGITASDVGLSLIAQAAEGSLRDAQSLLDQTVAFSGENISDDDVREILGTINRNVLTDFSGAILSEKPERIFKLVDDLVINGFDLRFFYQELIQHFRDLLLLKSVQDTSDLLPLSEEERQAFEEQVESVSAEELLRILLSLQQGEQGLRFSSHPRISLESLLIRLCHMKRLVPLDDLIKEVESMRSGVPAVEAKPSPRPSVAPSAPRPDLKKMSQLRESLKSNLDPEGPPAEAPVRDAAVPSSPEPEVGRQVEDAGQWKSKTKDIDKVLKDPTVQTFMKTFKGQVLSVEPIDRSKKS